jgi:hypothetical protein
LITFARVTACTDVICNPKKFSILGSDWLTQRSGLKTIAGSQDGLYLVLDAHSDLVGGLTVDSDFEGFIGLIDNKDSYPRPKARGFQIMPGVNIMKLFFYITKII